MDGLGHHLENIITEWLWRSLKQEAIYVEEISNGSQPRCFIKNGMAFYNSRRAHLLLDRQTKDDAYRAGSEERHAT